MNIPKEIQESRIAWAANDAKRDSGLQEPQGIEKFCDLDYAGDGITEHLLDVYRPVQNGENLPVLISIHGGGWFYGDKELYRFYCMHMAELGFVVVNCNYRLAPEHPYPAAIADVCQVIRWTLAHRKQYTSNPPLVSGRRFCRCPAGQPVLHSGRKRRLSGTAGLCHL